MEITKEQREIIQYNYVDFFVHAKYNYLSDYADNTTICHFHDDFEFVYIEKGSMYYNVNGCDVLLKEHEGIFVNAKLLHYAHFHQGECEFKCYLFSPALCSSEIQAKYLYPMMNDYQFHFIHLTPACKWQREIIDALQDVYDILQTELSFELKALSHIYFILDTIYQHHQEFHQQQKQVTRSQTTLISIIHYMQQHYDERIQLQDLCNIGAISKATCIYLFKDSFHETPMQFLTKLRIEKSCEYLMNSKFSITEIAYACGFTSSNYFSEVFHSYMHMTPTAYLKNMNHR